MKHVVACLLLLLGVVACTDGDSMRRQLQELQARNQADSLMTDLKQATRLCQYFDSHGTPNERMLAHYLLGRTYADLGEAPQALDAYHTAADCADTTAQDCDYRLLSRVHGQSANLFFSQLMPNEMLDELNQMRAYAIKAEDTLSWIYAKQWKHTAYDLLGRDKDALQELTEAYNEYMHNGYKEMAYNCLAGIIDYHVKANDYQDVDSFIKCFETRSSFFRDGNATSGHEYYYNCKGMYYTGIERYDSAEHYFRKELNNAHRENEKEAAYKGLYQLFLKQGKTDSVAKYADLCYQTSDGRFRQTNSEQLRHMQSLYNYNRNQKIAHQKTEEALRQRYLLVICLLIFGAITIISALLFVRYRRKKRREVLDIMQSYQQKIEQQELAKHDLLQLKKKETEVLIAQKEQEIAERQEIIEQFHQILNQETPLDGIFLETAEYKRFRYLCTHPREKVTKKDWKDLQEMMDRCLPTFYKRLNARKHLKESDYHICLLLRLHFAYSEICMLTITSPQYVYSRRVQLLKTVFDIKGKAEEFDKMLWHIT